MPKKKSDDDAILERFERGLRKALQTPPAKPRTPRKGRKKARKSRA